MTTTFREYVSLSNYTTLKVGGVTRYFVSADHIDDVKNAVAFAKERSLPLFVLGGGSNVLVADGEYQGVVLKMNLKGIDVVVGVEGDVRLTAMAGETLDDVVSYSVRQGWWGLENLSSIPGSVGAAPVQNVGAYGVEAGSYVESVQVLDKNTGELLTLNKEECGFGYRNSIFKSDAGSAYIVLAVTFLLSITPRPQLHYPDLKRYFIDRVPTLHEIRVAIIDIRLGKFPDWKIIGTAGSFFKNPIVPITTARQLKDRFPDLPIYDVDTESQKISLGYILDKVCGLKGYCENGICLYEKQALVLTVATDKKADDVILFANKISKKVFEKIGIEVEWEVVQLKNKK